MLRLAEVTGTQRATAGHLVENGVDEIAALASDNVEVTDSVAITVSAINDAPTFHSGDGLLNTDIGTGTLDFINSTAVQADGKIVAGGNTSNGSNNDFCLARYEGGVLDNEARMTIHVMHRVGALLALAVLGALAWRLARSLDAGLRRGGWLLFAALVAQLLLGLGNVLLSLPLPVAVAHNAGAAVLLLVVLGLNHLLHPRRLPA